MKIFPPKWTDVYPVGTVAGDEECRFFKALSRNPHSYWLTPNDIAKQGNLTAARVDAIIEKYAMCSPALIYPNPHGASTWGYWEHCPELIPDIEETIQEIDQKRRMNRHKERNVYGNS